MYSLICSNSMVVAVCGIFLSPKNFSPVGKGHKIMLLVEGTKVMGTMASAANCCLRATAQAVKQIRLDSQSGILHVRGPHLIMECFFLRFRYTENPKIPPLPLNGQFINDLNGYSWIDTYFEFGLWCHFHRRWKVYPAAGGKLASPCGLIQQKASETNKNQ